MSQPGVTRAENTAPEEILLPPGLESARVRDELERILASPAFRASKRSCSLLRHIVECALRGNLDDLKERRLGADVFERPADYDTNADHIVRSVAGEVRRRLAQYFMTVDPDPGFRIELQAGSYVPQFRLTPGVAPPPAAAPPPVARPSRRWPQFAAAGILALAVTLVFVYRARATAAIDQFWSPVYAANGPVLLCVGGGGNPESQPDPPKTVIEFAMHASRRMHTNDAMVLASVTGLLQSNGKAYRLLNRANTTTFRDLQSGPFVLIGSMNNEWSLRLLSGFRFYFDRDDGGAYIADRQNPSQKLWRVNPRTPIDEMRRDYAIVSRFRDPQTEQIAVVLAGIGPWGSLASGEFVTHPEYLGKIDAFAPPGWRAKNMQAVIATDIIHGSSGPPSVLAAHFW